MPGWLLTISCDTQLGATLTRAVARYGSGSQLWVVPDLTLVRGQLDERCKPPGLIVIDELFLPDEPLTAVAREFAYHTPVAVIGCAEHRV